MIFNLQIKNIFLIFTFLLIALPSCYIGIGGVYMKLTCITAILAILFVFIVKPGYIIKLLKKYSQSTTTKLMYLLFLWIIVDTFICSALKLCNIFESILAIIFRFIPLVIIPYFMGFYISRNFTRKEILKFYSILFLFVLTIGVLDFIFSLINFPILQYTLSNHHTLMEGSFSKTSYLGFARVQSVFAEPSFLGMFLVVHFFLIVYLSKSKLKIFKRKILNYINNRWSVFLVWLNMIFSMSPMYISILGIQTLTYLFLSNKGNLRKKLFNLLIAFFSILVLILIFYKFEFTGTFLERIHNTIISLTSIRELVSNSPSLANRIINYYGLILVFLKHPITGVGFGSAISHLYDEFSTMDIPLTYEIRMWLKKPDSTGMNNAILWITLAENGIIGVTLLYSIFVNVIKLTLKRLRTTNWYTKQYLSSILSIVAISVILSVYNSGITLNYIWLAVGILAGYKEFKFSIKRTITICQEDKC